MGATLGLGGVIFLFALLFGKMMDWFSFETVQGIAWVAILSVIFAAIVLFLLETFFFSSLFWAKVREKRMGTTNKSVNRTETFDSNDDYFNFNRLDS